MYVQIQKVLSTKDHEKEGVNLLLFRNKGNKTARLYKVDTHFLVHTDDSGTPFENVIFRFFPSLSKAKEYFNAYETVVLGLMAS